MIQCFSRKINNSLNMSMKKDMFSHGLDKLLIINNYTILYMKKLLAQINFHKKLNVLNFNYRELWK